MFTGTTNRANGLAIFLEYIARCTVATAFTHALKEKFYVSISSPEIHFTMPGETYRSTITWTVN